MKTNTEPATGVKKHLPNIASFTRIFGTLALPFLMWQSWEQTIEFPFREEPFLRVPLVWVVVYLFLVFTDKVDGTLARRLNAESALGAALDAIGDALLLVVGASCVFVVFVRDSLSTWEFWLYVGIMVYCVLLKILVFFITKKYFGEGNMLHSIPHKIFAVLAFLAVAYWAFTRTIAPWSIITLCAIMTYAFIDEWIYLSRSATYNVDFKGHGLEKYPLRERE
ncbi:MAG: CDP-alcohol phosphatidyltransferase family protein [Oscillospiraceae bacterium]|nr:CDP-alcohol phosphatidyltransferase family protein [Oscillospiraceae bacterium]